MNRPRKTPVLVAAALGGALGLSGCTEVRGRKMAQEANELYKQGRYEDAVARFEQAEALIPEFPTLQLNKGTTCRQLIIPGSKTPQSQKAATCALEAFKKFQVMRPNDLRGEQLYIQTLFDSDEFEELSKMFLERQKKTPCDIDVVSTLEQIYAKWDKFDEALEWYKKAADCKSDDPEKQYAIGVFIWQRLFNKGGGAAYASYDPRPLAEWKAAAEGKRRPPPQPPNALPPPTAGYGDIITLQRIDLAELGIKYLQRAVDLRPKYQEAMTYLNLLYRQRSFSYFDDIPKWQESVDKATEWMKKSLELLREQAAAKSAAAPAAPAGLHAAASPPPKRSPEGHP